MNVMKAGRWQKLFVAAGVVLALACCNNPFTSDDDEEEDKEKLQEMHNKILQLIGEPSCTGVDQCRYIAFGAKPCGGPWEYLVYSASQTDSTTLLTLVAKYNRFQAELNRKYGYGSDCDVPSPPVLGCSDGRCIDLR
jgi:hypothetical protein